MLKNIRLCYRSFLLIAVVMFSFHAETSAQSAVFKSAVDDELSIKKVLLVPMVDNVSDIYAKPLTIQLRNIIETDRQWNVIDWTSSEKVLTAEEYEEKPNVVRDLMKSKNVDAMIATRLSKGPNGINIRFDLFSGKEGYLLAQETLQDYNGFEIADVRSQLEILFKRLKAKLPYQGIILSRKNQGVTLNLGTQQGVHDGQDVNVVQIIKLNRHPKFKFMVSAEKEILGRVRITKAEESLSFGVIELEREPGVILTGMKINVIDFVSYPPAPYGDRKDTDVVLGDGRAKEWVPAAPPTFGKVGLLLGLGSYTVKNNVSGIGSVDDKNSLTPSIHIDGELWITQNVFMALKLKQYVSTLDNTYPNSSPGEISLSTTETTLLGGYNFLVADDFFGPKFQLMLGYSKISSTVDGSTPTAFTSLDFGGFALGMAGSFPISDITPVSVGAQVLLFLQPNVSEGPETSGASSSGKITTFSAFGTYKYTEHINIKGELMYGLYSASFSGQGSRTNRASTASHNITTLAGGLEFLF